MYRYHIFAKMLRLCIGKIPGLNKCCWENGMQFAEELNQTPTFCHTQKINSNGLEDLNMRTETLKLIFKNKRQEKTL